MTTAQDARDLWRENMTGRLEHDRQQGEEWQVEVGFYHALLALLNGQRPTLPADHPYAKVINLIQAKMAAYEDGS